MMSEVMKHFNVVAEALYESARKVEALKAENNRLRRAIAEAEQDKPVAVVTGMYGGRFIVEPTNSAMVLPVNMALYTQPQHREWIDLTGKELETLLRENRSLTLGAIWAVADKLKEKNV